MFKRVLDERGVIDDPNPWPLAPPEACVEWDRDVAPHLENMPEGTTLYWKLIYFQEIWVVVSFAVKIDQTISFKSVYWTLAKGWRSNYGAGSIAAELDWPSRTLR